MEKNDIIHNAYFYESANYMLKKYKKKVYFKTSLSPKIELDMETSPSMKYDDKADLPRTNFHWGQRKLLMSEIIFLMDYMHIYPKTNLIIYVGSAAGMHIPFLRALFAKKKKFDFILIDPAKFSKRVKDEEKRKDGLFMVINDFFTDKMAQELYKKYKGNYFFLSDIRRGDDLCEKDVREDMKMQADWIKILKPNASLLKFRLPWEKTKQKYFVPSKIYFQLYGRPNTTETRLVVDKKDKFKEMIWDCKKYEDICFYFNSITRRRYFKHDVSLAGFCHCFDCSAEILVWKKFLKFYGEDDKDTKIIKKFMEKTTAQCFELKYDITPFEKYIEILSKKNYDKRFFREYKKSREKSLMIKKR